MASQELSQANSRVVRRLGLVVLVMFGFGFAMWPLYNVFCDLTGLGGRGVKVADGTTVAVQKSDRQVKIRLAEIDAPHFVPR